MTLNITLKIDVCIITEVAFLVTTSIIIIIFLIPQVVKIPGVKNKKN